MTIDPVKLAKDNGLWPAFEPAPAEGEEAIGKWRDDVRAKIKKLAKDYATWAQSDKGVVDNPGATPTPIEMPLDPPQPSESEERHKEFRRITDLWHDTEYLLRYLPETEVWSVASALWQATLDEKHIEILTKRRRTLRTARFLSYLLAGAGACFAVVVLASPAVSGYIAAVLGGLSAVLTVFGVDFGFNKLEDKLDREQAEAETFRDREKEAKAREERQRMLARLGIPDDTQGASS